MYIDRILYPIESLGPGKRVVIWTVGCSKHCFKCANPELWEISPKKWIDTEFLFENIGTLFENHEVDGITVTGGDPLEQKDDLFCLLKLLRPLTNDILVYTGFTYEEIERNSDSSEMNLLNSLVDVLIDGAYIHDLNDNVSPLRGSSNQHVLFLNGAIEEKYQEYFQQGRIVQNVFYDNSGMLVGIHNKDC